MAAPGRFRIRQAALEDMDALAAMKALAWRQSYDLPEQTLVAQDAGVARSAELWRTEASRGGYFWAVVDTQDPSLPFVGVAHARASNSGDPAPVELSMIYLLDVAKGSGIADRLVQMAIGDSPAQLWVLEDNSRARAFCARHGFVADGARVQLGEAMSNRFEIRLVRSPLD